jgi:hypothetical protein
VRLRGRYSTLVGLGASLWSRWLGTKVKVTSLPGFDTRMLLSKKTARMGDEGKAVGSSSPAALLFEPPSSGAVYFDVDQRFPIGLWFGIGSCAFAKSAGVFLQSGTDLGHPVWWPFLFSSGLIRCNSIRDTVQAQHKHIPRQRNGHHSRDSEP